MGLMEALVALFGMMIGLITIGCITAVVVKGINTRAEVARARALGGPENLVGQVAALRGEVQQLREQNAELILSLDSAFERAMRLAAGTPPATGAESLASQNPDPLDLRG